jgi:hypothetical protein
MQADPNDVARAVGRATFEAEAAIVSSRVARSAGRPVGGSTVKGPAATRGCFTAGTVVETEDGPRAIDEINEGAFVLSRDEETGELSYQPVSATFIRHGIGIYELSVVDGSSNAELLETTAEHPFWVVERGWVEVAELGVGDELLDASGAVLTVEGLIETSRAETVYNIEVEGYHTYFVGDLGIWVHNKAMTNFVPAPKNLSGFGKLQRAKPKTSVQGGGGLRKRWKDSKGNIYEWDSRHGTVEMYNKRGVHLGEFDDAGNRVGDAIKGRTVEP